MKSLDAQKVWGSVTVQQDMQKWPCSNLIQLQRSTLTIYFFNKWNNSTNWPLCFSEAVTFYFHKKLRRKIQTEGHYLLWLNKAILEEKWIIKKSLMASFFLNFSYKKKINQSITQGHALLFLPLTWRKNADNIFLQGFFAK